jgi:hypothetical protein
MRVLCGAARQAHISRTMLHGEKRPDKRLPHVSTYWLQA